MVNPESPKRLQVAIIGAGLGGLLLALSLQKTTSDLDIDIYESATELTEIGAGVGMWPRMWEIMRYLGLEDELLDVSGGRNRVALPVHYRKADEKEQIEFFQLTPSLYTFHRSVLQQLLAKHLDAKIRIHFSKRIDTYQDRDGESDAITLRFKDGTSVKCDLLVGSDGIRSAVRRTMYTSFSEEAGLQNKAADALSLRSMVDPCWSGQVAYRGLIPTINLTACGTNYASQPSILLGKNKHVVSYPISRGDVVNVAAFLNSPGAEGTEYNGPWVSTTTGEEVVKDFATWEASVQDLLKSLDKPLCWAVHTVRELPTYVKGGVVLIGDAAHAMEPHQGAGAGQAVEDGFILATILAHPSVTVKDIHAALQVYDEIRRPFSQDIVRRSRTNGMLYELNALGWENVTAQQSADGGFPHERLVEIGKALEQQFDWSLLGSIMQDRDKALAMVAERCGL